MTPARLRAAACWPAFLLCLAASPGFAQTAPRADAEITVTGTRAASVTPLVGGRAFISPMGEPFRSTDSLSGAEHWFRQTDLNHNERLTPVEFQETAALFFMSLDVDHDDEIGPIELQRYEDDIAPDVKVLSTYGDPALVKTDSDGTVTEAPYPKRLGAGRFGYLAMPEPVAYADANFDRAVTRVEFLQAAGKRFKMLDANGDGAITRNELPDLHSARTDALP